MEVEHEGGAACIGPGEAYRFRSQAEWSAGILELRRAMKNGEEW